MNVEEYENLKEVPVETLFFLPLEKSFTDENDDERIVRGIASDDLEDEQGEVVVQEGMDIEPLLRSGFINWDHLPGPENIIGEPVKAEFVPKGLRIEAKLYKGIPRADAAWTLGKHLQKSSSNRRLGWSVQGQIIRRVGKQIIKSVVRHLALTHQPINVRTYAEFAKSMAVSNSIPLHLEMLAGTTKPQGITSVLWGDCRCGHFDESGVYQGGRVGAFDHLVKCRGYAPDEAVDFIKRLYKSNILR